MKVSVALDENLNGIADETEKRVYFEISDYSSNYIFFESPRCNFGNAVHIVRTAETCPCAKHPGRGTVGQQAVITGT